MLRDGCRVCAGVSMTIRCSTVVQIPDVKLHFAQCHAVSRTAIVGGSSAGGGGTNWTYNTETSAASSRHRVTQAQCARERERQFLDGAPRHHFDRHGPLSAGARGGARRRRGDSRHRRRRRPQTLRRPRASRSSAGLCKEYMIRGTGLALAGVTMCACRHGGVGRGSVGETVRTVREGVRSRWCAWPICRVEADECPDNRAGGRRTCQLAPKTFGGGCPHRSQLWLTRGSDPAGDDLAMQAACSNE